MCNWGRCVTYRPEVRRWRTGGLRWRHCTGHRWQPVLPGQVAANSPHLADLCQPGKGCWVLQSVKGCHAIQIILHLILLLHAASGLQARENIKCMKLFVTFRYFWMREIYIWYCICCLERGIVKVRKQWGARFEYCNRYWSLYSPVSLHHSCLAPSNLLKISWLTPSALLPGTFKSPA